MLTPTLRGDGHGHYRIWLVGNSGAGKTTLGAQLSSMLGIPSLSLDTVIWQPGWNELPKDEFRARVQTYLDQHSTWIIDGAYSSRVGDLVETVATDVIWLDPPFWAYFPRLILRTVLRLLRLAPPCSPGCHENLSETLFSHDSIIQWCWNGHARYRKRFEEPSKTDLRWKRFGGWRMQGLKSWLVEVRVFANARSNIVM